MLVFIAAVTLGYVIGSFIGTLLAFGIPEPSRRGAIPVSYTPLSAELRRRYESRLIARLLKPAAVI